MAREDAPGDAHDHFVAGAALGEFGDQRVARVVPAPDDFRFVSRPRQETPQSCIRALCEWPTISV
jgi:hypothetical protein